MDIDSEPGVAMAKLPFIMNPEEKLLDNRHMAKKRLDAICCRYKNDAETKAGILKAWEKFRTNSHLILLDELNIEDRKELEQQMVLYWIPWNMAFKDSILTPVRAVFDASAATPSSFSLNDCLVRATPNLVKLLSMLLE